MRSKTDTVTVPKVIAVRTNRMRPKLKKWRQQHLGVPWGYLVNRALEKFFTNGGQL